MSEGSVLHHQAIEGVIQLMRARVGTPPSLEELAAAAGFSPFHFSRIFREVTGSPPGEFLNALRLATAKHLLVTTSLSVTEICFEVGYTSVGSFTTRFTRFVGLPPSSLRRLASKFDPTDLERLRPTALSVHPRPAQASVLGGVQAPVGWDAPVCIGLFPRPIPQGQPIACTVLPTPGAFALGPVPDGCHYLMAATLPWGDDHRPYLLPGEGLLVAAAPTPIMVGAEHPQTPMLLELHPPRLIDPPVLTALPLLRARFSL